MLLGKVQQLVLIKCKIPDQLWSIANNRAAVSAHLMIIGSQEQRNMDAFYS